MQTEGIGHAAGGGQGLAPSVVGVLDTETLSVFYQNFPPPPPWDRPEDEKWVPEPLSLGRGVRDT